MANVASARHTRDLLLKLCGMLGSEFDGERATAALKITHLMRQTGWTWDNLIALPLSRFDDAAPDHESSRGRADGIHSTKGSASRGRRFTDWRADFAFCKKHLSWLGKVDADYVREMARVIGSGRMGPRSSDVTRLDKIATRLRTEATAKPLWTGSDARAGAWHGEGY